MDAALVRHQLHMLRGALPGSHAARLRGLLWRQIPSTGGWWTLEECGHGLYRYVYSDDPTRDVLAQEPAEGLTP